MECDRSHLRSLLRRHQRPCTIDCLSLGLASPFTRKMCALLCFRFRHDFPLSILFDVTPVQRWMQGPAKCLDGKWPQTRIRRRSYRGVLLRPIPRRTGACISRLARPRKSVVSSAQAALNLARRPPATRDRAMNSSIVARDVGGFPGKKQCVLNRTG